MNIMKKYVKIIKEFPAIALLCFIADVYFTAKYTGIAAANDPTPIAYFIALYGSIMAILLFCAGWVSASNAAHKKEEERRRIKRRQAINAAYSREFYGITERN